MNQCFSGKEKGKKTQVEGLVMGPLFFENVLGQIKRINIMDQAVSSNPSSHP